MIREANTDDFDAIMKLYTQLNNNPIPDISEEVSELWNRILSDKSHHIIVAEENGEVVSTCVCVIIPNLTRLQRPYALVENVVTDKNYRKLGLATACLNYAKDIAKKERCYKIMLMTGSKRRSTLRFYRKARYNSKDKTAFIQWL